MKERMSIRIKSEDRNELQRRAAQVGKSLSEYTAELIHEAIDGQVRTDLLIQEMQENIVQLSGMLSIMQAYNTNVYAVLLGRTNPTFKSPEEKKEAIRIRNKARENLKMLLSAASKDVLSGENVWGTVEEEG